MCLYQVWQILLYSQSSSKNPAQDAIGLDSPIVNALAGSSYLNGHLEYYNQKNRNYTSLAFASVEVYNGSVGGDFLGRCDTDMNGNFTVGPIDSSPSGISVTCCVLTMTDAVTLYDGTSSSSSPSAYNFSISGILIPAGQNKSMSNQYYDFYNGFTVFSYDTGLNKGWYYILNTTGNDTTGAVAYYPNDSDPNAPCYYNATHKIVFHTNDYLYTDTILHEYAHYVMHCLYGGYYWPENVTGPYYVTKATNATQAWVEGWAWYFPMAVDNNGTYDGSDYNLWDFEDQTWNTTGWDDGDTVVGRVAGALFDIYDEHNDTGLWSYENMTDGFGRTWNTISTACWGHCDQFRMFWIIWNGTYYVLDPNTHQKNSSSPYNGQDWKNTLMTMFQSSVDCRAPGDVIVDGKVNVKDLSYVLAHNWEQEGVSPNWNYLADLVHDGKIDVKDVALVTANLWNKYDC